jgi:hypothetical protein
MKNCVILNLLMLCSVGGLCAMAGQNDLQKIRQEAVKRAVKQQWDSALENGDVQAVRTLLPRVLELKIDDPKIAKQWLAAMSEPQSPQEKPADQQRVNDIELLYTWRTAVVNNDIQKAYALAPLVLKAKKVTEDEMQAVLQQVAEHCVMTDSYNDGEQEVMCVENPLHAVHLQRLQEAKNDQVRSTILQNAFGQLVDTKLIDQTRLDLIKKFMASLVEKESDEERAKVVRAFTSQPFCSSIKGALDPECYALYIQYQYGLWCPNIAPKSVKTKTALRWLKELIYGTTMHGKPVNHIINLCHDRFSEKPVAYNLAAACLYHQLILPLKAKKRTNVIVQLSEAHLFDGTPYFQAVEEAASPAPSPVLSDEPDESQNLLERFEKAYKENDLNTLLDLKGAVVGIGAKDDRVAACIQDVVLRQAEHGQESFYQEGELERATQASIEDQRTDELRRLYNQALEQSDVGMLRELYIPITQELHVSETDLQTQIVSIESLHDSTVLQAAAGNQQEEDDLQAAIQASLDEQQQVVPAVVDDSASQAPGWIARFKNAVTHPAVLSATAALAAGAWVVLKKI